MKPILQALLVADHVYQDVTTGKKIVAGIFHRIFSINIAQQQVGEGEGANQFTPIPQSGMRAGSPFCYISITEIRGKQQFSLRYVHLEDDKVLFKTDFHVECNNPLETVEINVPLPMLPSDKTGTYALELLCDDEPLGSHRISVVDLKEQREAGKTDDDKST